MKTTTTMKARFTSLLLALIMVFSMIPISVFTTFAADSKPSYVALGDSISTGYGLEGYTVASQSPKGFTYLLANELGYSLTNLAVDGNTASGILAQLETEAVKTAVTNADLITITAGGNDLMGALYQAIADDYNTQKGTNFTGQDVMKEFADGSSTDMSFGITELGRVSQIVTGFSESSAFGTALQAYKNAMFGTTGDNATDGVIDIILDLNPDATIILATQYNPYKVFNTNSSMYKFLYSGIEAGLVGENGLNAAIEGNATSEGYITADVYKAFADSSENLCNAADGNLDFHPNATGHKLIADTFKTTFASLEPPATAVTGVSLDQSQKNLLQGLSFNLVATVSPADATNRNVSWRSSDETIATVSNDGVVTAVTPGNATITVTTADGSFTATCAVSVTGSLTGNVSISGTAKYGETLTANYNGPKSETVDYQWYRGDSVIDGAKSSTYTLTAQDIGKIIKVAVIGTGNYVGTKEASTATVEELIFADDAITVQGYSGKYDGNPHGITVTVPEGADVKYGTVEGTYNVTESPTLTDVGELTVYYQVTKEGHKAATGLSKVNISKATPNYTIPTGLTAIYGQTLADIQLPAGFTWQDSTTSVGNVGSNTFNVTYTPTDTTNYSIISDIAVTVTVSNATFTINATCDNLWGTVTGGGSYEKGTTVTLTAKPADSTKFEYWLDADIAASWDEYTDPTEEQLRAAIVSDDATYTFKAEKNISLEAVFSIPTEIGITPMLIAGTDESDLLEAERMDVEYDFGSIIPGAKQIALPGEVIDKIITIGEQQYRFAGFITFSYDEENDTATLKETLTIDAMPLYGSAEWWDWFIPISDGVYAAYMPYTPDDTQDPDNQQKPTNPETPDEPQNPTVPEAPDEPQNPTVPETPDEPQNPTVPEAPDEPQNPTVPEAPDNPQNPSSPQTGDNSNMALWFALLFISGGAIITLTVYDRKRRKTEN